MKITCPTCSTSYNLPVGKIGPEGRNVRCSKCGNRWHATEDLPGLGNVTEDIVAQTPESFEIEPAPTENAFEQTDDTAPDNQVLENSEDEETTPPKRSFNPFRIIVGKKNKTEKKKKSRQPGAPKRKASLAWLNITDRFQSILESELLRIAVNTSLATTAAAMIAGSIFFRDEIVRENPDLADLYALVGLEVNLRGLSFQDFRILKEIRDHRPVLIVEGYIQNELDKINRIPSIRVALRGYDFQDIYTWIEEPPAERLRPKERLRFQTRLEAPPKATDVELRFIDRRQKDKDAENEAG